MKHFPLIVTVALTETSLSALSESSRFLLPSAGLGQYVAASGGFPLPSFRKMETVHENVTEIISIQFYLVLRSMNYLFLDQEI